jgi:hypothetical protein
VCSAESCRVADDCPRDSPESLRDAATLPGPHGNFPGPARQLSGARQSSAADTAMLRDHLCLAAGSRQSSGHCRECQRPSTVRFIARSIHRWPRSVPRHHGRASQAVRGWMPVKVNASEELKRSVAVGYSRNPTKWQADVTRLPGENAPGTAAEPTYHGLPSLQKPQMPRGDDGNP